MRKAEVLVLSWLAVTVGAVPVNNRTKGGTDKRLLELECRFGNFCDQFVVELQM